MAVEVRLKLRHRGCYSEELGECMKVVYWNGDGVTCLSQVYGSPEDQARILDLMAQGLDRPVEVVERTPVASVARCPQRGLSWHIGASGATVLWPVVHTNGHEWWRLWAPEREGMDRALEHLATLGEVEVLQVVEPTVPEAPSPLRHFMEDMTPRQLDALRLAWERGYYDHPRRTNVEQLAEEAGVSPSTFQEHLQKGHRHLVAGFTMLLAEDHAGSLRARRRPGRPRGK